MRVVYHHPIPPLRICLSVTPIPKIFPVFHRPVLIESKFSGSRASIKCCCIRNENTHEPSQGFSVLKSDIPCDTGSIWSTMALYIFSFHIPLSFGGLSIVAQVLHQSVLDLQTQALSVLVLQTLELLVVLLLLRFTANPQYKLFSFFEAIKLSKGRNWLLASALGFGFLVFLVFLTSFLADRLIGPKDVNNSILKEIISSGPVSVTACILVYCIITPFLEETVYRGFLLTYLSSTMEWHQAVIISSAVFSAAHLSGNLHTERFAAAKSTLLKPNPWPFDDGVYFFHNSTEQVEQLPASNADRLRLLDNTLGTDENSLAIVAHAENTRPGSSEHDSLSGLDTEEVDSDCDKNSYDRDSNGNRNDYDLVIPGVLHKEEICELHVRFIGVGQIAARVCEKDGSISRMWCEWLGKKDFRNEDALMVPEHDFAIVSFAYNYDLGRKGLLNDVRYLLLSNSQQDIEGAKKKRRKSFSDPEDISESLSNQYDSSGEETLSSNSSSLKLPLDGYDDQLLHSGLISSKTVRRELRKQQRVAAEKMCDICQHKLLPGKDVATLFNMKTGRIVCSSRNVNGAFHVYHISCLVHWILLCESEIHTKQMVGPEVKRTSRRKTGAKKKETEKHGEMQSTRKQIYSVFCPECQGRGIKIRGDELEKPTVALSEVFKYKIKISDARRAWMKSPEELQNCSTGFKFPSQSDEATQEKVTSLKLLHFYRADE